MSVNSYSPPVDLLLAYGDCRSFREWPNYLELGFGREHIPELIRMATDDELNWADSDSSEVWAPVHAWRTLGQLRAEASIDPLLRLFDEQEDSDWVGEEMPKVFAMIGPAAVPALTAYLADSGHGMWSRVTAAVSLEKIASAHPSVAEECVTVITRQLERFLENDATLNAFLISSLMDLKATASAPTMERAFDAGCVDETVVGDWYDVQVEMGLREPDTEFEMQRTFFMESLARDFVFTGQSDPYEGGVFGQPKVQRKAKIKAKAKRKKAKASRKLNRKRK